MAGCAHDGGTITVVTPKDAEGRNVLLDTKVMYNAKGIEYEVARFIFGTGPYGCDWDVECFIPSENIVYTRRLDSMYLEKPESLKRLAEKFGRAFDAHEKGKDFCETACNYADRVGKDCDGCPLNVYGKSCFDAMMEDIMASVNRLCGDAE